MTEHAVANGMSVVVDDDLEVVQVEHDQGKRGLAAGGPAQLALQALLEEAVVVEAGEAIRERLLLTGDQTLEHHQAVDGLRRKHRQQVEVRLGVAAGVGGVDAERAA